MITVALIGADGAGKTTIAHRLAASFPLPVRYLYMGMNAQSANIALPTSRLLFALKARKHRKAPKRATGKESQAVSLHSLERRRNTRGRFGAAMRLIHRLAEQSLREFVSWIYRLRGYIVIYDRHFLFDFARKGGREAKKSQRPADRIQDWFLRHVWAKPDLVIFLDAPPEVLYERKREVPVEYLRTRREAFLTAQKSVSHFERVDASQPLEQVYSEVVERVANFCSSKHPEAWRRKKDPVEQTL
jgi:thymidylate kinase